jgi:hypothetical protein
MRSYHLEVHTVDLDKSYRIRMPTELFDNAMAKAKRQDLTLAQVIRRLLREWVQDPPEEARQGEPKNEG